MRQVQIRMKLALTFFILGLGLGFSLCEASDGFQIRIWTEKSNFLAHEPIGVHYRATNIGDRGQCINLINMSEDFDTATTIHKLGHQRAILHHHDDFGNSPRPFCMMNKRLIYSSFNTYSNPHFCNECINKIKNINW